MKKFIFLFLFLFTINNGFSQNSKLWKGYFSYNEIKDLSESPNKIVVASENALFTKNLVTGNIKTTNTIDGLSGQTITSIYYSPNSKKTLIGYKNGLIIIINEIDGSLLYVVDIINKTLPPNIKKINHFMEYNGIVYISCDFGIVQYNLNTLLFLDTYFIGNGGAQIAVSQTAIFDNKIYAATFLFGMRSATITNPNLNDFNQWTTLDANGWTGVETFGDKLLAVSNTGFLYSWQGTTFSNPINLLQPSTDIRKSGDYLLVTTANSIYIYNTSLVQIRKINTNEITSDVVKFNCAAIVNDKVYIGTFENGLFSTTITPSQFEYMTPNGPLKNNIFAITATTKSIWAVFGDYDISYNPDPLDFYGISKYSSKGWVNTPLNEITAAVGESIASMVRITVNPNNENQVFISSFHSGLLKIENNIPSILYNQNNSGLEAPSVASTVRINGTAFDKTGNLWVSNSIVKNGLKVLKANNTWQSYNMEIGGITNINFGKMSIDKNGTKWMGTRGHGIIGFNEGYNNLFKTIGEGIDNGNLPAKNARVAAVDNNNQLWIGTLTGLRVLSNVDNFLSSGPLNTDSIIIIEENLAQELLFEQAISDIVVNGANYKWIGTADSGVFLVSPDGQQTIYHFTTENSPLPSNGINDIDINGATGEVFFATNKGMVSFKGTSTDANDNLNNVFVFPNPVRPEYTGTVKVSGLIDKANVKIADIEGNLVYETIAEGGTIEWDTTAFGKYRVASGVYMIFISAEDGGETKVKKVMIIR